MHSVLFAVAKWISPEALALVRAVYKAGEAIKTMPRHA